MHLLRPQPANTGASPSCVRKKRREMRAGDDQGPITWEIASHNRLSPSDLAMIIRQSSNDAPAHTCRAQNSTIPQVGMKQTTRARTEYSAFPTGRMAASSRTNSTPAHDTQTTSHTHILVHRAQNKDVSTNTGIHSQSFSDRRMRLLHEFRINKEVARRPI